MFSSLHLSSLIIRSAITDFIAEPDEEISAVLATPELDSKASFVIGTVRHQVGEYEPSSGRLILFKISTQSGTRDLRKLIELDVHGCVYAIASVGNAIAAAVNTAVGFFSSFAGQLLHA